MSAQQLASKWIVQEEEPQARPVAARPTSIPGFVILAERGPMDEATLCSSETEYKRIFGGSVAGAEGAQCAAQFFGNAGDQPAYFTRTCHHSDASDPTTKTSAASTVTCQTSAIAATSGRSAAANAGPYDLEPSDTIIFSIDGGGDLTATFLATRGTKSSADGGDPWPKILADAQTLTVKIDGGAVQTVTFHTANFVDITNATAAEVAAVIAGQLVGALVDVNAGQVRIQSDKRGTASSVEVTGGSANAALSFPGGVGSGTGNVANIDAVTPAEVVSVITAIPIVGGVAALVGGKPAITSSSTGGASTVLVKAASTADTVIGFDNATHTGLTGAALNTLKFDGKTDGTYGNAIQPVVEAASSAEAARFNVRITRAGVTLETFPNCSMDNTDPRFVETIINDDQNGSQYVKATDLAAATPAPNDRPANGAYTMTGGNDGLAALNDNDFIGGEGPNGKVGIRTFDTKDEMSLLAIPGRATSAVHNAMISYCEVTRAGAVFAVLDPPASTSASGMVTYVDTTAAIRELSEFAAIYWPRIKIANPSKSVFGNGETITVAPSPSVCGTMARNDQARDGGVYDAPAGIEKGVIFGCLGFETEEANDEVKRDLVYPKRINPIHTASGQPRYIDGSYTLKSTGDFPTVSERRGATFIEQSVKFALEFARHRNNDESLRSEVTRTVETFLLIQLGNRAFRSMDPATAFFVDFSKSLNTDAIIFAGKLIGRIGIATQKPVQFGILRFSQFTAQAA